MTLNIRDAATERLVRTLAKTKNIGLTEAVRLAVANELGLLDLEALLRERIAAIRASILHCPCCSMASTSAAVPSASG